MQAIGVERHLGYYEMSRNAIPRLIRLKDGEKGAVGTKTLTSDFPLFDSEPLV